MSNRVILITKKIEEEMVTNQKICHSSNTLKTNTLEELPKFWILRKYAELIFQKVSSNFKSLFSLNFTYSDYCANI